MDDIWLFGRSESRLREMQLGVQATLRTLGLELNVGKTTVLEGDDLDESVWELEHSAVDGALARNEPDEEPLDALIERVLSQPETTERTSIRFLTTRMREHTIFTRVSELADCASMMPHGADHLARLFRDSGHWRELQEWYVSYAKRWEKRLHWSVAQLGTMFPTSEHADQKVIDLFAGFIKPGSPLPVLSLAAQRLSAWSPSDARVLCREAAASESHPLSRRTLALACVHSDEIPKVIREMLQQHEENQLTLGMLEDRNFDKRAVRVPKDFAG